MTNEKTLSEILHGDTLWRKHQAAVHRMLRMGKTEMVVLDAEAGVMRELRLHYAAQDALTRGMGYGKGMQRKRSAAVAQKVMAEVSKRNPARAAELAVGGVKAERNIAWELKRLREWKDLNWGYLYGRGRA